MNDDTPSKAAIAALEQQIADLHAMVNDLLERVEVLEQIAEVGEWDIEVERKNTVYAKTA